MSATTLLTATLLHYSPCLTIPRLAVTLFQVRGAKLRECMDRLLAAPWDPNVVHGALDEFVNDVSEASARTSVSKHVAALPSVNSE